MTPFRFLLTSLILASVFLWTAPAHVSKKSCMKPTRTEIQKILGPPVECVKEAQEGGCYGNKLEPIRVHFNLSGVAESVEIVTYCNGLSRLKPKLDQIVPEKARGDYIPHEERPDYSCRTATREEYECVNITYEQDNCMGCAPASISVVWK
jgi:hypothetical protein